MRERRHSIVLEIITVKGVMKKDDFDDLDERDRVILNRYEFNREDYENAVPCDGDCE